MKTELFKKLIKEAVREVLREELLTESPVKQVPKVTKYAPYTPPVSSPAKTTFNPIADLMAETKASMMTDPGAGHYMDMSQHVSAPGMGMESSNQPIMMEESFARPEPGLDISQFDFVKKAAAVYNASVEKDKERFGV